MSLNILVSSKSLWFLQLVGPAVSIALPLPARVAWQSLDTVKCVLLGVSGISLSVRAECMHEIQRGQSKEVQQSPLMSEVLESGLPHLLSVLSVEHNLSSTVFKIRLWMASQELMC